MSRSGNSCFFGGMTLMLINSHLCFATKQKSFHSKQELPLTKHQLGVPPFIS
jgi:hypothetical protein